MTLRSLSDRIDKLAAELVELAARSDLSDLADSVDALADAQDDPDIDPEDLRSYRDDVRAATQVVRDELARGDDVMSDLRSSWIEYKRAVRDEMARQKAD